MQQQQHISCTNRESLYSPEIASPPPLRGLLLFPPELHDGGREAWTRQVQPREANDSNARGGQGAPSRCTCRGPHVSAAHRHAARA